MFPHPLRQINCKYRRVGLCVPSKHSHYVTVYMAPYPERVEKLITLCGHVIPYLLQQS
jgi:hypothetical protein